MEDAGSQGLKIVHELKVNARAAGPRLGKQVQFAIKASKTGAWHVDAATGAPVVETPNGEVALEAGEYELINRVEEENAAEADASVSAALPTGGFVILDTVLTADLEAEGYARDVIRAVQDAARPRPGHRRSHRPGADRAVRQCGRCRAVPRSDRP